MTWSSDAGFDDIRPRGRGHVLLADAAAPAAAQAEHLARVYRLADPTLSELALEPLLDELLERTKEMLDVDTVAVLLIDESAGELVARAARGLEAEVEQGVRIPLGGGFAGRIAAERAPIFIADVADADILNPILREAGVRSLLGVPMLVEGRVTGVVHVGTLSPRTFTEDDAVLLQLAASRASPAIERARLHEALDREHRDAVTLQRSLLPGQVPVVAGVEIAARYRPARDEIGGDWYDVVELPDGLLGVAIGDVAGHGVRAAALMGQLRIGLRAYALAGHPPGQVLMLLDGLLRSLRDPVGMATALYGILDPKTGALRLASAGHLPPVLISAAGEARVLEITPAPPLGVLTPGDNPEVVATLAPGETLLIFTDGLIERRGESLDDGLRRLRRVAGVATSANGLCARVIGALVPALGASDDVALVAVRRRPEPDDTGPDAAAGRPAPT